MADDNFEKSKEAWNEKTGLPDVTEEEKAKLRTGGRSPIAIFLKSLIMPAIGYGIANLIYYFGDTETYNERMSIAKDYDL